MNKILYRRKMRPRRFKDDETVNYPVDSRNARTSVISPQNLQRKSDCACGGSCPQCKQKEDFQISQPNDAAEVEADQTAEKIMRMTADSENETEITKDEEEIVARKSGSSSKNNRNLSSQNPFSGSQGKSLDSATQSFFEARFKTDFSNVKIHDGIADADFAEQINARAFTIGNNVGFADGEYQPHTEPGRLLLAHELTHVVQQNTHRNLSLQRKAKPPDVPADLLKHPELTKKTDEELQKRHDKIAAKIKELEKFKKDNASRNNSDVDKNLSEMKHEIGRIGQELGNRHTFSLDAAQRMKEFFQKNVKSEAPLACINTLRSGLHELYDTDSEDTPEFVSDALKMSPKNTIEETMGKMQKAGLARKMIEINFLDDKGKVIGKGSGKEPKTLQESVWDKIISIADVDRPNVKKEHSYFVFGLSLGDGFHSITLTLDYRDKSKPKIRWSDQTHNHDDGWEEYQKAASGHPEKFQKDSKRGLDEYIEYAVNYWWNDETDPTKRLFAIVRLWRLNQPFVK